MSENYKVPLSIRAGSFEDANLQFDLMTDGLQVKSYPDKPGTRSAEHPDGTIVLIRRFGGNSAAAIEVKRPEDEVKSKFRFKEEK